MANSVYSINKGINKSIEFRGLKAQYIWYFGGGVMVLLVLFAVLYIVGVSPWVCLVLVGGSGVWLTVKVFALSHKYGEYGLMKELARRRVPRVLKSYGRRFFLDFSSWNAPSSRTQLLKQNEESIPPENYCPIAAD